MATNARRVSTTRKALTDLTRLAPVVASQRLQKLSVMTAPAATLELSSLMSEKYFAFVDIWFQTMSIATKMQMRLLSQAFSGKPLRASTAMASIVSQSGHDVAHASATSLARRVRKNLRH